MERLDRTAFPTAPLASKGQRNGTLAFLTYLSESLVAPVAFSYAVRGRMTAARQGSTKSVPTGEPACRVGLSQSASYLSRAACIPSLDPLPRGTKSDNPGSGLLETAERAGQALKDWRWVMIELVSQNPRGACPATFSLGCGLRRAARC
jgi:hypothetical protein